jgi:hypothetical protein
MLDGCFIRSRFAMQTIAKQYEDEFVSPLWTDQAAIFLTAGFVSQQEATATSAVDVHDEEAIRRPNFTQMPFDDNCPCDKAHVGKLLLFVSGPPAANPTHYAYPVATKFGSAVVRIWSNLQNAAWLDTPLQVNMWRIVYDVQWNYAALVPSSHSFFKDVEEDAFSDEVALVEAASVSKMKDNVMLQGSSRSAAASPVNNAAPPRVLTASSSAASNLAKLRAMRETQQ